MSVTSAICCPDGSELKSALTTNANVIGYASRLLALNEGSMPSELELDTLDTVGRYDFGEKIQGPVTAHPRFDPVNGDLLFFAWQPAPPYLTWYRADRDGTLVESQNIDTGFSSLVHDFIATDNYAIFFECPSAFKLENAKRGEPLFIWEPETRHTHSRHERQER